MTASLADAPHQNTGPVPPHNTHHKPLLEGDPTAHLRRLSLPMASGLLAMSSFGLVDTFYISRLGTSALAALGFTMPVVIFFLSIIFGQMVGTTSVLSRVYGEGDLVRVRRLATDALVLGVCLTTVAALLGHLVTEWVFPLMGATPDLMPMIRDFMSIWYLGMPFTALVLIGNACLRAGGDTRMPGRIMIAIALFNAVIDPFLIYGWAGLPRMGLAGAALTLVLSHAITAVYSLYLLCMRMRLVEPGQPFHAGTGRNWRLLLHVGIPSILSNQIVPISAAAVTWIASGLGQSAVAALGVATRIEGLAVLPFFALGVGVSIFTGQNYGAGNYGRIREALDAGLKYVMFWSFGVTILFWALGDDIPRLFDRHADVLLYTAQYLYFVPMSYLGMGVVVLSNSMLNAMGRPLPASLPVLLRAFALYIPLAYAGAAHFGFAGILFATSITNIVAGVTSHLWNKFVLR